MPLAALILAAALAGPGEAAAPKAVGNPFDQLSGNWLDPQPVAADRL
jgi:hypothetical protein